jgi:hypothetical protein
MDVAIAASRSVAASSEASPEPPSRHKRVRFHREETIDDVLNDLPGIMHSDEIFARFTQGEDYQPGPELPLFSPLPQPEPSKATETIS